jgi:hypothetical protein
MQLFNWPNQILKITGEKDVDVVYDDPVELINLSIKCIGKLYLFE